MARRHGARMVRPDPSVPQAIWRGGAFTLEALTVRLSAPGVLSLRAMLGMRREELLEKHSTSPEHESARFVPDMQDSARWLLAAFAAGGRVPAVRYVWDEEAGDWAAAAAAATTAAAAKSDKAVSWAA